MTTFGRLIFTAIIAILIVAAAIAYFIHGSAPPTPTGTSNTASTTMQTYGMDLYTDQVYGFTFWYPSQLQVVSSSTDDATDFPGGVELERLQVGPQGGVTVAVVESTSSTITDEPNQHASPIAQTKYFYDSSTAQWMVAYPEGSETGSGGATTTANVTEMTAAGLPMLPSGARFDTTIIPLSTTEFLVIQDGGGSSYTNQLATTVATGTTNDNDSALSSLLQAESNAYSNE